MQIMSIRIPLFVKDVWVTIWHITHGQKSQEPDTLINLYFIMMLAQGDISAHIKTILNSVKKDKPKLFSALIQNSNYIFELIIEMFILYAHSCLRL